MAQAFHLPGPYEGHAVRTARREWTCQRMTRWAPIIEHCRAPIAPGQTYVEGEVDPDVAGGFAMTRVCMNCARRASDVLSSLQVGE